MRTRVIEKPFRGAHADIFEVEPGHESYRERIKLMELLAAQDICHTFMLDGRVLFIAGMIHVAPGVGELFIYPSVYAKRFPKEFYQMAKWWIEKLKEDHHRLQCWGEDTDLSRRWLSRLGFKLEGELLSFTVDGKSMLVWGIVCQG